MMIIVKISSHLISSRQAVITDLGAAAEQVLAAAAALAAHTLGCSHSAPPQSQ